MASNWKRFRRVWSNYEIASRYVKQPKEERTAKLLMCLGADALEIVDGLNFANDEERKNTDVVLQKLEVFCVRETNEVYERFVMSLTNGIRSQASPLIRMLHHFARRRRRVIMIHFWMVSFATE